jgi:acetyl esterase/lipase
MERSEVDRAYDNAAVFPDVPQWRVTWQERSAAVPIGKGGQLDVPYGPALRQKLDIFPSPHRFWSRNGKDTFRYIVRGIHAAGCNAVFVGYSLAPDARLDRITAEAREAVSWVHSHLASLSFAPHPLIVTGWSAGAQLAAMVMDDSHVGAGIGVSGVYDPAPLLYGSINDTLHLDADEVRRNAPALHLPSKAGPFVVAYGARELPAFQDQSHQFYEAWVGHGLEGERIAMPGHHHHSALDELYQPDGILTQKLWQFARSLA